MSSSSANAAAGHGTEALPAWQRLPDLVESYQSVQRKRLQVGERIQAVAQGRKASLPQIRGASFPEVWSEEQRAPELASLFVAIRKGLSDGPVPHFGRTYRRHWQAEAALRKEMTGCLACHPAWNWLRHVKGVGATLVAQLLVRLDIEKAGSISSFWAYCGLDTVPGAEYRCSECGLVAAFPAGQSVSATHARRGSREQCSGRLRSVPGGAADVRVAQPKPARDGVPAYDPLAKQICTLIGNSLLKAGGPYSDFYREELRRLEKERQGWAAGRRHTTALRKTEKLFLAHLWLVWREAVGLPSQSAYPQDTANLVIDPWKMVGQPRDDSRSAETLANRPARP